MKSYLILCISFLLAVGTLTAQEIKYQLNIDEPHTHYCEVIITAPTDGAASMDFKMPVWAPGSYLVREFARHVEAVNATNGQGKPLSVEKTDKNTWHVNTEEAQSISFSYKVYAFEMSVRTSFIDASHGYLNGSSIFMYIADRKNLPCKLDIAMYKDWKKISTSLESTGPASFKAENYDIFIDSPIEMGNHKILEFEAAGVKHKVAIYGEGNYPEEQMLKDMKSVIESCTEVFGENPNKEYTFIIHNLERGSGGLEHLSSTTLQVSRWNYSPGKPYEGFLGLVAHEYFHLWNVKRLRPIALGPFDYDHEVYTTMLWVMEGFTSYYDEYLLIDAGVITPRRFLNMLGGKIGYVERQPGNKVQPVADASFDAWIKAYRPHENSSNTSISYYSKGALVGAILDLEIMNNTNGDKSLADLMKYLYNKYYKEMDRGFTDAEFREALNKIAGKDMTSFLDEYVHGTKTLEYEKCMAYAGLALELKKNKEEKAYLGAKTSNSGGNVKITGVVRGSPAYEFGLNVNDELVAIDEYRINGADALNNLLAMKQPGDKVTFTITRDGKIMTIKVTLDKNTSKAYKIVAMENPSKKQLRIQEKWLGEILKEEE